MKNKIQTDMNVNVNIRMCPDHSTAESCLKIVELYLNATGKKIGIHRKYNGEIRLTYEVVK